MLIPAHRAELSLLVVHVITHLTECIKNPTNVQLFKPFTSHGFVTPVNDAAVNIVDVHSVLACSMTCLQTENCNAFSFDSGVCTYTDDQSRLVSGFRLHYANEACPLYRGYAYKPAPLNICYKIHQSAATRSQARDACENEGGHLVVTDEPTRLQYIADVIYEVYSGSKIKLWIDGNNFDATNNWILWDGTSMSWISPEGPPMGTSEHCMEIITHWDGNVNIHNSKFCSSQLHFVCEIDMPT